MFRKFQSSMFLFTILLASLLILGTASNGYSGSPEPPGYTGVPAGGKTITGYLSVGLSNPHYDPVQDKWVGDAATTFIGTCGKMTVAIGPFYQTITLSSFMTDTEEGLLEGETYTQMGPPGCFSEAGGEDLIIIRVKKFERAINYYYDDQSGDWVILWPYSAMGAELTLEQYVPVE